MAATLSASDEARKPLIRRILDNSAAAGITLMAAAALALVVANSPLADGYFGALGTYVGGLSILHWINDGLMAIFFLFVGLEIKREFLDGRLSTWEQRRLPALPAAMGMAIPAGIFLLVVGAGGAWANGWAIPAATDIAFALGVLALLGKRAPTVLKLFLVTVAIIDDIGAVAIIALFYTSSLNLAALAAAGVILAAMYGLNRFGVRALWPYLIGFAALWFAMLLSGVHATIAGVLAAFVVPLVKSDGSDSSASPLHRLEHALAPWVGFLIVPIFGFANAGVSVMGLGLADLLAPLPLGIAAGLFLGKQLGVFGGVLIAVKSGLARKPEGATWLQIYGVALLCGIGFTMSLFVSGLAFTEAPAAVESATLGILLGSILSAVLGCLILRFAPPARDQLGQEARRRTEILTEGDIKEPS